jgi:hypothetical protein
MIKEEFGIDGGETIIGETGKLNMDDCDCAYNCDFVKKQKNEY